MNYEELIGAIVGGVIATIAGVVVALVSHKMSEKREWEREKRERKREKKGEIKEVRILYGRLVSRIAEIAGLYKNNKLTDEEYKKNKDKGIDIHDELRVTMELMGACEDLIQEISAYMKEGLGEPGDSVTMSNIGSEIGDKIDAFCEEYLNKE